MITAVERMVHTLLARALMRVTSLLLTAAMLSIAPLAFAQGPDEPAPPSLGFAASAWNPSAIGRGQLALTIGEAPAPLVGATAFQAPASEASALLPAAPVQAAAAAPLKLRVELTPGARAFPDASQDARCSTPVPSPSGSRQDGQSGGKAKSRISRNAARMLSRRRVPCDGGCSGLAETSSFMLQR